MIENNIILGKTSLMYSGSMFLNLASFLETKSPITTVIEIKNPYHLTLNKPNKDSLFASNEFDNWRKQWGKRIKHEKNSYKIMQINNPIHIPRNHLVESALKNATNGNKKEFDKVLDLMSRTYDYNAKHNDFQTIPEGFDESYKTFCGT